MRSSLHPFLKGFAGEPHPAQLPPGQGRDWRRADQPAEAAAAGRRAAPAALAATVQHPRAGSWSAACLLAPTSGAAATLNSKVAAGTFFVEGWVGFVPKYRGGQVGGVCEGFTKRPYLFDKARLNPSSQKLSLRFEVKFR